MVMLATVALVDDTNLLLDRTNHDDVMRDWKLDDVPVPMLLLPKKQMKSEINWSDRISK